MGLGILSTSALVHFDVFVAVYWERTVGIDSHQKETRVRLTLVSELSSNIKLRNPHR